MLNLQDWLELDPHLTVEERCRYWLSRKLGTRDEGWQWHWWDARYDARQLLNYTDQGGEIRYGLNYVRLYNPGTNPNAYAELGFQSLSTCDLIPGGASGEWAMACRLRCNQLPADANYYTYGGAAGVAMGALGYRSTTKWAVDFAGGTGDLVGSVDLSTDWTTLAIVRRSGLTRFFVNEVPAGSGNYYPTNDTFGFFDLFDSGSGTARSTDFAWQGVLVPSP